MLPAARVQSRKDAATGKDPDKDDALSLEGTALAPLDRVFPTRPVPFLLLVIFLCAGAWGGGYALAPNKEKFLASVEWRFMPFYLAAHLIAVRLFITAYTRNFRAGIRHLEVGAKRAARGVRTILGPFGLLLAMLIAAPFCYLDWQYLYRPESRYERMGEGNTVGPIDQLMWGTWCVEWTLNALIWVMLVAFLIKNVVMIRSYAFRAPIELVLHERHYRPFLQMSSQGATIVLGFSAVTIFYLWYTGGELTDYAGLAITAALLFVGFFPSWILLRRKVRRAVESETLALRHAVLSAMWRDAQAKKEGAASADIPLEQRLSEALAIFRVSHLEQLKLNLGLREARAVVFRLLAPVIGVAWQVGQSFEAALARFDTTLKAAKAFLARFLL